MTTARDIMSTDVQVARLDDTLVDVARRMRDRDIGAVPILGRNEDLSGIITDRDIVRCIAEGHDPKLITAAHFATERPITVNTDADIEEVQMLMGQHQIRRIPVISNGRLVGVISQGDLVRHDPRDGGETIRDISQP